MSTRSTISRVLENGNIEMIYCHQDGGVHEAGKTLLNHYNDPQKIDELFKLGDLSNLGKEIGQEHEFEYTPGVCTFYGRDRRDDNAECVIYTKQDYLKIMLEQYNYIYDGKWYLFIDKMLVPLKGMRGL